MYSSSSNWLNVVLHGLFVIHVKHDHIELLTPFVHEHVYYAGHWVTKVGDLKSQPRLEHGQIYDLVGVNQFMHCPPISLNSNTVVSKSLCGCAVHDHHSHFKVRLPFPADLAPLRSKQYPSAIYAGRDASKVAANGISLCQVFVYPVATFDNVRLWGTDWKPNPHDIIIGKDIIKVDNLHLWAEPPMKLSPSHGRHAYHALMHLLPPLELEPLIDEPPEVKPQPTGILGLSRCELYGLAELDGINFPGYDKCAPKTLAEASREMIENIELAGLDFGSHVTNCQSVTVVSGAPVLNPVQHT